MIESIRPLPFFVIHEEGIYFIDPFTHRFNRFVAAIDSPKPKEFWTSTGIPVPAHLSLKDVSSSFILTAVIDKMKPILRGPLADKEWLKMVWLYDRIAVQLGVAPAKSYPRVRP
jgi:hypothetical protein